MTDSMLEGRIVDCLGKAEQMIREANKAAREGRPRTATSLMTEAIHYVEAAKQAAQEAQR